jgi:transposase
MATRQKFELSLDQRRRRHFSEDFKRQKVSEIERKVSTVLEISRQYEVTATNVYRWIEKYGSKSMKRKKRLIVESESDTRKLLELKARIAELERMVGQKQILIDFQEKMTDLAEERYGIDIKKKSDSTPSCGSGDTANKTPSA